MLKLLTNYGAGCASCAHLANKIVDLERRISTLYQIQEAKKCLNTIIFGPAQTNTAAGSVPPSVIKPATATLSPAAEATPPPVTGPAATGACPAAAAEPTLVTETDES